MPTEPRLPKVPAAHSTEGTSGSGTAASGAQLSPSAGVQTGVSSMAMDRGLLPLAGAPPQAALDADVGVSREGRTDAEIMLQVKAGDDSAFAYLVHKSRRP